MNNFKLLGSYIRKNIAQIISFFLFGIIFSVIFYLSYIPVDIAVYSFCLCFFFWLIIFAFRFNSYRKKHLKLVDMLSKINIELADFPSSPDIVEQDYQQLVTNIYNDRFKIINESETAFREMIDYYTLWAHQIKTPIAAMRLLLQSESGAHTGALEAELFKIEQYVDMVLSYLRLGSETTDFVFKEVDVDEAVKQAVRKYAKMFILKKLSFNYESVSFKTVSDKKWLMFVIEQILSNSIKYTKTGEITIKKGEGSSLIISDTGIGIAPEDLPRIFEKGFTGYNGRVNQKSTGIGLYLCRSIIDKLGHKIEVFSEVGKGTSVVITFPENNVKFE